MALKTQEAEELYSSTIEQIASSPEEWQHFLDLSGRMYPYPFADQVMIYAQRPGANFCAGYSTWRKNGHPVKKGVKGIALIRTGNFGKKLEYIFDYSDTYRDRNVPRDQVRTPHMWRIEESDRKEAAQYLKDQYHLVDDQTSLAGVLRLVAENQVPYVLDSVTRNLITMMEDPPDALTLRDDVQSLLEKSVQYTLLKRCGLEPEYYIKPEELQSITLFSAPALMSQIGNQVRYISCAALKHARQFAYEKKQGAKEKEQVQVIDSVQPEQQARDMGHEELEQNRAQSEQILVTETVDKNRFNQEADINGTDIQRGSGRDPVPGADTAERGDERPRSGGSVPENERTVLPEVEERDPGAAAGTGGVWSGGDLRVSGEDGRRDRELIDERDSETKSTHAPSVMDRAAFISFLQTGSGRRDSIPRIMANLMEGRRGEELAEYLKEEYGVGGKGFTIWEDRLSVWYDSSGIKLYGEDEGSIFSEQKYSWQEAADRITELYETGNYCTPTLASRAMEVERDDIAGNVYYYMRDFRDKEYPEGWDFMRGYPLTVEKVGKMLEDPAQAQELLQMIREDGPSPRRPDHREKLMDQIDRFMKARDIEPVPQYGSRPDKITYITAAEVEAVIQMGNQTSGGKEEIYRFFQEPHSKKEEMDYLKDRYGIGGHSPALAYSHGFSEDHDGRGIHLRKYDQEIGVDIRKDISWSKAADLIRDMVRNDRYLREPERERLTTYLDRQSMEDYRAHVVAEISKEAENYGLTADEYAANNYEPYTSEDVKLHINFSENEAYYDREGNEINRDLPFAVGNVLLAQLDAEKAALQDHLYDKTDFDLSAVIDGEDFHYHGRYDIGDGDGTLVNHIRGHYEYLKEEGMYFSYSQAEEHSQETIQEKVRFGMEKVLPYLEKHTTMELYEEKMLEEVWRDYQERALSTKPAEITQERAVGTNPEEITQERALSTKLAEITQERAVSTKPAELPEERAAGTREGTLSVRDSAEEYSYDNEYRLLSRLKNDCEYFLSTSPNEKTLWAGNVDDQIMKMWELYERIPEKPDWLSAEDIRNYDDRMAKALEQPSKQSSYSRPSYDIGKERALCL